MRRHPTLSAGLLVAAALAQPPLAGCASPPAASNVELVQQLRAHLRSGEYDAARAMMTPDPRRWFNERSGEGGPWRVGSGPKGPWAHWDDYLGKQSEIIRWVEEERAAVCVYRETNGYFLLLDRGWVTNHTTYFFDEHGRIEGILHAAAPGPRPQGRTDEFLAWARANVPEELEALMPGGNVDPSGDHPRRFRAILERWRADAGLGPIETGEE